MGFRVIKGNVGQTKYGEHNGKPYFSFSVAENHSYKDREKDEWVERGTLWHNCEVWGDKAEYYKKFVQKGVGILVVGKETISPSEELDENNNPKYLNQKIVVGELGLLTRKIESITYQPKKPFVEGEANQNNSNDLPFPENPEDDNQGFDPAQDF